MQKSLMVGLNEKDMEAVIRTYGLKDYYYPTLFPLKETNFLTWKMLEAQSGLKIAADLVARGATIPRKTREAISRIQGDIPKITISREKNEDELTEYDIMVAMSSNNPDLKALVEFWAEDTKFCWDGVAARAEWIALKQISLGKVKFTNSNNAAVVTEYDVDYLIPAEQKIGVTTDYTAGTAGKPFTKDVEDEILGYLEPSFVNGLSLLGGEPFEPQNQRVLVGFLERTRKMFPKKDIWCYTGYTLETDLLSESRARCEVTDEMLSMIDVLVDGEFIDELKNINLRFRGSENQRIIDLPETLKSGKTVLSKYSTR